jgi:hypothetical protein
VPVFNDGEVVAYIQASGITTTWAAGAGLDAGHRHLSV